MFELWIFLNHNLYYNHSLLNPKEQYHILKQVICIHSKWFLTTYKDEVLETITYLDIEKLGVGFESFYVSSAYRIKLNGNESICWKCNILVCFKTYKRKGSKTMYQHFLYGPNYKNYLAKLFQNKLKKTIWGSHAGALWQFLMLGRHLVNKKVAMFFCDKSFETFQPVSTYTTVSYWFD